MSLYQMEHQEWQYKAHEKEGCMRSRWEGRHDEWTILFAIAVDAWSIDMAR